MSFLSLLYNYTHFCIKREAPRLYLEYNIPTIYIRAIAHSPLLFEITMGSPYRAIIAVQFHSYSLWVLYGPYSRNNRYSWRLFLVVIYCAGKAISQINQSRALARNVQKSRKYRNWKKNVSLKALSLSLSSFDRIFKSEYRGRQRVTRARASSNQPHERTEMKSAETIAAAVSYLYMHIKRVFRKASH